MVHARAFPQQITYWPTVRTAYGFSFEEPQVIAGRWEDKAELFINEEGETSTSRAVVYLHSLDVKVGDYLALVESVASDPTGVAGAYRVRSFSKVPNLRANTFLRKAIM